MAADCVKCDWKEYTSRREREIINSKTAPGQYLDEPFPVKKARAEGAILGLEQARQIFLKQAVEAQKETPEDSHGS